MRDKTTTLEAAVATVSDGDRVALGGNTLHRGPFAAVHELVRQGRRNLELVKTAGAYDVDLLTGMGVASSVSAGFVGFETEFGLAPSYRRTVEGGGVVAKEHACYTVIAGLRAAIQGVPFMPIAGMLGSDLLAARDFRVVDDPYTGEAVVAVPALRPDVALIHVQEADALGNCRIVGTRFEDVLMAQASRRVIVTAERIVDGVAFEERPEGIAIASIYVDLVVEAPGGARPGELRREYGYDADFLREYVAASRDAEALRRFVDVRILSAVAA